MFISVFNDAARMVDCIKAATRLLNEGTSCLIVQESEFTFASPICCILIIKSPGCLALAEKILKSKASKEGGNIIEVDLPEMKGAVSYEVIT